MNTDHRVVRPSWTCVADGSPWPCPPARKALYAAFTDDLTTLRHHLVQLAAIAEHELPTTSPTMLYRRFLAWSLEPDHRCPACDSPRHTAIPGIPPRFIPCNNLHGTLADADSPDAG